MKVKTYCCDATRHMYEQYYADQSGSGIPVFVGQRHQRGHGLAQATVQAIRHTVRGAACLRSGQKNSG